MYDKIANVQNVRPGGVAIITLPCSKTYDKIKFKLGGGLTYDKIDLIEFKANGKTFLRDTGTFARLRQAYKGIALNASYVTMDFTEPFARGGVVPQLMASIPANLLATFTIEVTLNATANVASTLECHVEFREATQNPFIRKLVMFNTNLPTVGDNDLILPAGNNGGIIKRIWLHGTDKITGYDMRINGVSAFRAVKADWQMVQSENKLVPQAGLDVIDFIVDGNMQGALNTGMDKGGKTPNVEMRVTVSAAEAITGYIEYIDPIGRL